MPSFDRSRKAITPRSAQLNPEMPANVIIGRFGGLTRFCDWTGYKTSTVWDWQRKGFIPADRQPHVLEVAQRHGIELEPADFVFQPQQGAA